MPEKTKKSWSRRKKTKLYFEREEIWCSICKKNSIISWSHVKEIVCGRCLAIQMMQQEGLTPVVQKVKFKRGWNLKKKFTAPNGDVYSYGKLIKQGKKRDKHSTKTRKKN